MNKGIKYGRLTAIKRVGSDKKGQALWSFRCICGTTKIVARSIVLSGHTRSCGCSRRKPFRNHPLYRIFVGIKNRCENKNDKSYKRYGGRGIRCKWTLEDFILDMERSFGVHVKKHGRRQTSIERKDNNGPYSKENCRWATYKEQAKNRRNTVLLTFRGSSRTLKEWGRILKISPTAISSRLKNGWDLKRALTQPNRQKYHPRPS